jgi:hypothetical protein
VTIDRETLAAYADGELGPEDMARVEAAIAADPVLAAEVEAHRNLRAMLGAHFAPIAEMPVPQRLSAPLARPSNVVDLGAVRSAREAAARPSRHMPSRWIMGGALAASLVLGIVLSGQIPTGGPIRSEGGQLVASGKLDSALTSQLASADGNAPVRILLSFRAADGSFCRGFQTAAMAGIACREGDAWVVERTQAGGAEKRSDYRQAGSASAAIMAAAQDMAADGALGADAERAARDGGWRK